MMDEMPPSDDARRRLEEMWTEAREFRLGKIKHLNRYKEGKLVEKAERPTDQILAVMRKILENSFSNQDIAEQSGAVAQAIRYLMWWVGEDEDREACVCAHGFTRTTIESVAYCRENVVRCEDDQKEIDIDAAAAEKSLAAAVEGIQRCEEGLETSKSAIEFGENQRKYMAAEEVKKEADEEHERYQFLVEEAEVEVKNSVLVLHDFMRATGVFCRTCFAAKSIAVDLGLSQTLVALASQEQYTQLQGAATFSLGKCARSHPGILKQMREANAIELCLGFMQRSLKGYLDGPTEGELIDGRENGSLLTETTGLAEMIAGDMDSAHRMREVGGFKTAVDTLLDPRLKNKRFNETEPMQRMLLWIVYTCSEPHIVTRQLRAPPMSPVNKQAREETKEEAKEEAKEETKEETKEEEWEEVRLLSRKLSCTGTKSGNAELLIELKTLITMPDPRAAYYAVRVDRAYTQHVPDSRPRLSHAPFISRPVHLCLLQCRALANFLTVETDFHNGATVECVLEMFKSCKCDYGEEEASDLSLDRHINATAALRKVLISDYSKRGFLESVGGLAVLCRVLADPYLNEDWQPEGVELQVRTPPTPPAPFSSVPSPSVPFFSFDLGFGPLAMLQIMVARAIAIACNRQQDCKEAMGTMSQRDLLDTVPGQENEEEEEELNAADAMMASIAKMKEDELHGAGPDGFVIKLLVRMIVDEELDAELRAEVCDVLRHTLDSHGDNLDIAEECGVHRALIRCCRHEYDPLAVRAAEAIGACCASFTLNPLFRSEDSYLALVAMATRGCNEDGHDGEDVGGSEQQRMQRIEQEQEGLLVYNSEGAAEGEVLLGRPASSWRRQLRTVAAEVLATACSYDQSVSNKTTIRQSGGIDALCDLAAEAGPFPMGYNTEDGGYWYTREVAMGRAHQIEGRQRPAALLCLGELVRTNQRNKEEVAAVGGVQLLVALANLRMGTEETRDYAVLNLGSICYDGVDQAEHIMREGGIFGLVQRLVEPQAGPKSKAWACSALARLARFDSVYQNEARRVGALEALLECLNVPDEGTQLGCIECIRKVVEGNPQNIMEMRRLHADEKLIEVSSAVTFNASGNVRNAAAQAMTILGAGAADPNATPRPWV
jgi:hypothetical protein